MNKLKVIPNQQICYNYKEIIIRNINEWMNEQMEKRDRQIDR